jgi:hypothetical protein
VEHERQRAVTEAPPTTAVTAVPWQRRRSTMVARRTLDVFFVEG